jgi:hypothetical protein
MQMAAEVDLASALARKEAAQSFRKQAADFVALSRSVERLETQIPDTREGLARSRRREAATQRRLAKLLSADIQPVEVVNNEVVIHPVQ